MFITVHGLNGHIAPSTGIVNFNWQNTKYLLLQNPKTIITTDIWGNYYTVDKVKTCKTDGIEKMFHNRTKSRLCNKKRIKTQHYNAFESLNIILQKTVKSAIASSKDIESVCKQASWLAPAHPACTPNYHRNNAINYFEQKSSSYNGHIPS